MENKFKRIVSFARKRVRNKARENKIIEDQFPKFQVNVNEDGIKAINEIFPQKFNSYILEIGFGSGENIIAQALDNPNQAFIGCEVYTSGVTSLLEGIEENKLENIRIWHDDAMDLVDMLPDNSLDLVYILHPDPWPKKRHNKRRLINEDSLRDISKKMKPGSKLLIITDHDDYASHITKAVDEVKDIFLREFDNYPAIVKTKYRLKADAIGVESEYFGLKQI
jgi:tRNA (guanine-N7-)-methyltransferase